MIDKEEHRSGPYQINSSNDDSAVEDDFFDKETAYEAWQENPMTGTSGILRKYWIFLVVLILVIIGFVLIYNIMRPKTKTVRLSQTTVLKSRIEALESQMARLEEQIANKSMANESGVQPEMVDRLSDRMDRLERSIKTWMEEITTQLEAVSSPSAAKKKVKAASKKSVAPASKKKKASVKEKKKIPAKKKEVTTGNPGARYHIVQKEETLYRISLRYGLSVERLKEINQLSDNTIKPGQKLKVSP